MSDVELCGSDVVVGGVGMIDEVIEAMSVDEGRSKVVLGGAKRRLVSAIISDGNADGDAGSSSKEGAGTLEGRGSRSSFEMEEGAGMLGGRATIVFGSSSAIVVGSGVRLWTVSVTT